MTWSGKTTKGETQPTRGDQGEYPPAGAVREHIRKELAHAVPELSAADVLDPPAATTPDILDQLVESGRLRNN